ncbi:hypothetical protein [Streptomyces sp. NPDC004291]
MTELRGASLPGLDNCPADRSHVRVLEERDHVGTSPVGHACLGSKRHLVVEHHGTPFAAPSPAATGNVAQFLPLLDAGPSIRDSWRRPRHKPRHLYADQDDNFDKYRRLLWKRSIKRWSARRGVAHGSGLHKVHQVVGPTFAWFHRLKQLRTHYGRRADLHRGLLELACSRTRLLRLRTSF